MNTKFVHFFCIMAFLMCFAYLFYVSVMGFKGIAMPDQVKEIVIGVLGLITGVTSYVVGSSVSSRAKDKAINDAINNNQTTQP